MIHIGPSIYSYIGDMGTFDKTGAGLQAGLQFTKKRKLNGAISLGFGQISDDDPSLTNSGLTNIPSPNSFFKTSFFFTSYDVQFNIINNGSFVFFISQGVGFMAFSIEDENGEDLSAQTETRATNEDYRNSHILLPTSIGTRYKLADHVGLGVQISILNTNTDYLDNISSFGSSGNDNVLSMRFSAFFNLEVKRGE